MAKKNPPDDALRDRYMKPIAGLDRSQAKKVLYVQHELMETAKEIRELIEPGPATDEVYKALDNVLRTAVAAIKDPTTPAPKMGRPVVPPPKKPNPPAPPRPNRVPVTPRPPKLPEGAKPEPAEQSGPEPVSQDAEASLSNPDPSVAE